ncbi:WD40 repeat domain-containing protein [Magnetococcales bacterium HHB-1]
MEWIGLKKIKQNRYVEVAVLEGHERSATSVSRPTNDQHVVSGAFDTTVRIWQMKRGEETTKP